MTTENFSQTAALADASLENETKPPARILVVDDDADIRQLNTELLLTAGYEVDAAEDGAVAWNELQSKSYDLLVTDNNMPHVSGIGLLEKLHVARMAIPVILVTGEPPTAALARHPWLHIEALLLKPYAADELLAVVNNVLRAIDSAAGQIASPTRVAAPVPNRLRF